MMHWWKHFVKKMKKNRGTKLSNEPKLFSQEGTMSGMKIEQYKKRFMECTAVYAVQEICAHDGLIWTMKFSADGQYLASGGEDRIVCIWRKESRVLGRTNLSSTSVVIPERIFHIEEQPLKKFHGHAGDVLDVAWSTTNHILSSSMDKTVRIWHVDSDKCLGVFYHSNYVTCVQFNPVDNNYFISGSIDGKVRIWGVHDRRVVDWANVQDVVTAVCYQPNGKGFIVGSVSGNCHFYEKSGNEILLNAKIDIRGQKKSSGNKITGIQFLKNESQRVMITSEDSKIRILDGLEVVHIYRGLPKSKTQMSASFTSSGRHIISVGENCHIYVWNYDELYIQTSKQAKSVRSCEHFFFQGVSVALPWSGVDTELDSSACASFQSRLQTHDHLEASLRVWDSERFSLANWFSMDGSSRSSITWPEEKLPLWDLPPAEHDCQPFNNHSDHLQPPQLHKHNSHGSRILSTTWGLVILTAGWDGMIRTFHNYGLPVRI
ncbi:Transducin/WD40 repeat-like superfamily protein [Abeliophyllum distichum]|uniref:Transducin/WD40 repeat-like superfamily protein n=1 Tax=Abeliophyllum distichum TaxID=126358 RepID=A0ABD1V2R0_9LAMI